MDLVRRFERGSVGFAGGLVGELEIPAVEAVGAAVGDDLARFPRAVLAGSGEEMRAAAAVDARDHGVGFQHPRSLAASGP
jgi:hypothetical protein